jgi:O-antigen/teichoic acid export membrane protein
MYRRLAAHVSNYSLGSVLVTLASIVSFPVLTRLLSVDEYGVMNLIATVLALTVALAKLGVQHSAVRFYSEVKAGKHGVGIEGYASTVVYGMAATGLAVTLLWALASQFIPDAWWNDERVRPLMLFTAVLILVRVIDSALINQLRAQERSVAFNTYSVLRRYVGLAAVLAVLFFVSRDLWGFYAATVFSEIVATLLLVGWLARRVRMQPSLFSPPLFRAMLAFGIPMLGYELATVMLSMSDRYVIQTMLGAQALGTYAATYNMCEYVRQLCLTAFVAAVLPMYPRIWEEQGVEATRAFLQRFLHIYVIAATLVVAGLSAISGEVLAVLASEKYRSGAAIVPYVIAGMALDGVTMVAAAGLYIEKRSKTIMLLIVSAALLNIGLNVAWVPLWGTVGSAAATLVSYAALLALSILFGRRRLAIALPWLALLKFGLIGVVTFETVSRVDGGSDLATIFARVAIGLPVYAALCLLLDAEARRLLRGGVARLRRGAA